MLAAGALGLVCGLGAWAWLGAYHDEDSIAGFFVACLLMAAVYGAVAPRSAVPFGAALVLGPVPMSVFTTHQGDGDGLWLLVVPMVAAFGLATAGTAAVAAAIGGRIRPDDPVSQFIGAHVALVCTICIALSTLMVPVTLSRYPDPWPEFEAVLDQASLPDEFAYQASSRTGSPIQVGGGAPAMRRVLSSSMSPADTCDALREVFAAWVDDSSDWEFGAGGGDRLCGGNGSVSRDGSTYGVSVSAWETMAGDVRVAMSIQSPDA